MSFADKLLYCTDCKKSFNFSVAEQELHAGRGFINVPRRCPPCRQAKKSEHGQIENASEDFSSRRQTFPVNCTRCGKATRVPFQPHASASVYCSDCYIKSRVGK